MRFHIHYSRREVHFTYTNHRGVISKRRVRPDYVFWGTTEYHPESQWLMFGWDIDKQETRTFAMKDMRDFEVI